MKSGFDRFIEELKTHKTVFNSVEKYVNLAEKYRDSVKQNIIAAYEEGKNDMKDLYTTHNKGKDIKGKEYYDNEFEK